MMQNVLPLGEVASDGTAYLLLKIKILAKREREFTTKFAIARNGCWPTYLFLQNYLLENFSLFGF